MKDLSIRIINFPECGYSVYVNGEVLLECLAQDELDALTVEEIVELHKSSLNQMYVPMP